MCEEIAGKKLDWTYDATNRSGDHIWWISDVNKFRKHFSKWAFQYSLKDILVHLYENNADRWIADSKAQTTLSETALAS